MINFPDDYENGLPIRKQPLSEGVIAVVTACNDEKTIMSVVKKAMRKCERCIVIDDGSDDRTVEIAKNARAEVITHVSRRGYIASFNTAVAYLRECDFKYAIFLSASGQHEPGDMHRFVKVAEAHGADIVCGSRDKNRRSIPGLTKLANTLADSCIRFKYGYRLNDPLCNYRLLTKKAIKDLPPCKHHLLLSAHILRHAYAGKMRVGHLAVTVGQNYVTKPDRARRDLKQSIMMSLFILLTPIPKMGKEDRAARKLAEESENLRNLPAAENAQGEGRKRRKRPSKRRSEKEIRDRQDRIADSKSPEALREESENNF